MDALEAKFAGGFGQQTDKEGNTKMVSQKRSSFEGLRYNGDTSQFEKKAFETTAFEKRNLTEPLPSLKPGNGTASNPSRMKRWKHRTSLPGPRA